MSSPAVSAIVMSGLRFAWPDGTVVLDGLDAVVPPGRTGLVGLNGCGKSTLLRLIAGDLRPARGSITTGEVGYLPQNLVLDTSRSVAEVLGIADVVRAIAAIERGETAPELFDVVGDDWDAQERARAMLDQLGLADVGLDRRVGELSGGQTVLLGLASLFLARPDVLVLDEPTNNLDRHARERLYAAIDSWSGAAVIVSHDRELLARVDQIAELRDDKLRVYGGNFAAYEQAVQAEQEAAERAVRTAQADVRRQQRDLTAARTALARRLRYGRKQYANKREPKIVMNARKREAQVSAGRYRIMHEEKAAQAKERLAKAEQAVRDDDTIRIDLAGTTVPSGRKVLRVDAVLRTGLAVELDIRGPERIGVTGRNGSGKTTLLRTITGAIPPASGQVEVSVPVGFLPQRLDILDDQATAADNVARVNPAATPNTIRAQLARLLLKDGRADLPVGVLSGGERFRAALATLLIAHPQPQLLLLDEPTNNLDLSSVRQLVQALRQYRGALIVASHDEPFLAEIDLTRRLHLEA
ncbi:ABC-F family ATP-binding cassette domain-containing protein [Thermocrispum sp.]|uniref:ABC-F family ATP-binding cassette domain-containing protein n=2 Tax=Thermocrispum agreste TaxID=37925 RepID=A0ABD6FCR9_9PSEU|nr:ABC-F family ATP-binding cassette domain-containing protein [Thermocrispum sp.]